MEIWKDIPDYEGGYQISNLGNVKSFKWDKVNGKLMSMGVSGGYYHRVYLAKGGKRFFKKVHKLMQTVFDLGEGYIDHINGIKTDNRLDNLRVVTPRQNLQNTKRHRKGGLVGASLCKNTERSTRSWRASIYLDGKQTHLGMFETELEAHNAYLTKLNEIGETL